MKINELGVVEYYTKSKPVKVKLRKSKDFTVLELNNKKSVFKKNLKDNFYKPKKEFTQISLIKENYTTNKATIKLSKIFRTKINYAGLKDKRAYTSQFLTIKSKNFKKIKSRKDFKIINYENKRGKTFIGNLVGNEFLITLKHNDSKSVLNFLEELKNLDYKLPNFFAEQRFGLEKRNHKIGEFLIKKHYKKAYELVKDNNLFKKNYKFRKYSLKKEYEKSFKKVDKRIISLFYHAYQSYLFNLYLSENLLNKKKLDKIIDFNINNKEIKTFLEAKKVNVNDFKKTLIGELKGFKRNTFMRLNSFNIISKKPLIVNFWLIKNCFATNFIREIVKEK